MSVDLTHAGSRLTVTVDPAVGDEAGLLTCKATHRSIPRPSPCTESSLVIDAAPLPCRS